MSRGGVMQRPKHVTEQSLPNPRIHAVGAQSSTAKQRDTCSTAFLKAHFGAYQVINEDNNCGVAAIAPLYSSLCQTLPFSIDRALLQSELEWLDRSEIDRLISPSSPSSSSLPSNEQAPSGASSCTSAASGVTNSNRSNRINRRTLVLFCGGVSSVAALSATLKRADIDEVFLCYLVRVDRANTEREVASLLNVLRYGRDATGKPFVDNVDQPATEALRSPTARIRALPMPTQPYLLDQTRATSDDVVRAGIKHHPLTYLLIYRQALVAAHALGCHELVWGLYGVERQLIESAGGAPGSLFAQIQPHCCTFPFDSRHAAYNEFCEAAKHGDNVWSHLQQQDLTSTVAPIRTESACVMADAAQWAWTCSKPNLQGTLQGRDESAFGAATAAATPPEEETAQNFIKRRMQKEQANDLLLLPVNWCGACVDCAPWIDAVVSGTRRTSALLTDQNVPLSIANRYAATMAQAVWSNVKPANVPLIASDSAIKNALGIKASNNASRAKKSTTLLTKSVQFSEEDDENNVEEEISQDDNSVSQDDESVEDDENEPMDEEEDDANEEEDEEEDIDEDEEEIDDSVVEEEEGDGEPRDSANSNVADEEVEEEEAEEEEEEQWDDEIEDDVNGEDELGDAYDGQDDDGAGAEHGDYDY